MKLRNWISVGWMAAGLAMTAQAQEPYHRGGEMRETGGRFELRRRVEADRRAVEEERMEFRRTGSFHEARELRMAQERLERDLRMLRGFDRFSR
jgi:hypothetical protein